MDLETSNTDWSNMRRGIDAQPDLISGVPFELYERSAGIGRASMPSRVYLTGCGDSLYCGEAARFALEEWTGLSVESIGALGFSRYALRTAPRESLLIAVSNSGEVARTIEAATFANQAGLSTLAVSYKANSRLAKASEQALVYSYPEVGFGPGTISYTASLLALLVAGVRLGIRSGRLDDEEARALVSEMSSLSQAAKDTIAQAEAPAQRLAADLSGAQTSFIIGGGPNVGTAHFGMAKMIESYGHNAVPQELEEWAHEQYFCCVPGTYTIVIAPPGASVDRAREQLQAIRDVGGLSVVVCDVRDAATQALADHVFPVSGKSSELMSPLLYGLPLQVLAYHAGIASGKTMLGFDDEHRRNVNMRQILRSNIPESPPEIGHKG